MSHYRPYPKYKDSGVEWLGEVPEGWLVTALKRGFEVTLGKMLQTETSSSNDELLPYLRAANIQWAGVDITDIKMMWITDRDRRQLRLIPGDLLISEGGDAGRSCIWNSELEECYFQNSVNRVRARNQHSNRYLYYWISTIKSKGYVDILCNKSTIAHFTAEKVAAVPVPFPTSSEQQAIAAFLDRETTRIDTLIAKKTRFIELLKEKRQAVITQAVTKGLDDSVPMKDSGVKWLGMVPAHWAVCKVNLRYSIELGKMLDEKRISGENLLPYLRNQDVQWEGINDKNLPKMDIKENEVDRYTVSRGDLLVCEGGDVGRAALWRGESRVIGFQKALHRVRPRSQSKDTAEFFIHSLRSAKMCGAFEESDAKSTISHLPAERFRQYRFAFPDFGEQVAIARHIEKHSSRIELLLLKTQRSIELLKEHRAALITAAVTGKIDVREAA